MEQRPVGEKPARGSPQIRLGEKCGGLDRRPLRHGGLRFCLAEVKFRRYLKTARAADLLEAIEQQIKSSFTRWQQLFGEGTGPLEKTIRRAWLIRILRFYARKARRHSLSEDAFANIERELEKLGKEGSGYSLSVMEEQERTGVGFVFCPEYTGYTPSVTEYRGVQMCLFGPSI